MAFGPLPRHPSNKGDIMEKLITIIIATLGIIGFVAIFGLLFAFPIKWCWNYTMPYLFELKEITWGQAWCLNFICHCLIKASQTNNNN